MDREHERVFNGCRGGVFAAVDGNSGRIITTMPIGPGVDALEFDAAKGLIYVSIRGDGGSLSVFHEDAPDTYSLVEKVTLKLAPAAAGARGRGAMVPGSFHVLVFGQ